jgi:RNA-dependent RNA polymerase
MLSDTAMLTWMPEIVSAFRPAPLNVMPSDFLEKNFKKNVETLVEFQERISKLPEARREFEFHRVFLLGLGDSKVGLYSRFHDNAIYQHGYDHEITVREGHMYVFFILRPSS